MFGNLLLQSIIVLHKRKWNPSTQGSSLSCGVYRTCVPRPGMRGCSWRLQVPFTRGLQGLQELALKQAVSPGGASLCMLWSVEGGATEEVPGLKGPTPQGEAGLDLCQGWRQVAWKTTTWKHVRTLFAAADTVLYFVIPGLRK